jgi:ribosomal protein S18 acetylase RimI-like enzyme
MIDFMRRTLPCPLRRGQTPPGSMAAFAGLRWPHHAVLETSAHWNSAVGFYERHGFTPTEQRDGDQHFRLDLGAVRG